MKKVLIAGLILFLFSGFSFAQEEGKPQVKEEKKIVIKIIDDEGNVTTKILEGDEANEATENIWISENGDSITVEVELEDGDDIKTIRKKIILSDLEGMDFEGIEMFELDEDFGPGRHPFFGMEGMEGFNPEMMKKHMFFKMHGFDNKAKLGVHIQDVEDGVKVTEVVHNSTAYSIGILAGDVITKIEGKKMTNTEEVIREVGNHQPGDMIDIKLKRNGKSKYFSGRLQGESGFPGMQNLNEMPGKMFGPKFHGKMDQIKHQCYRANEECEKLCEGFQGKFHSKIRDHKQKMKMHKKEHKHKMKQKMKQKHMKKEMEDIEKSSESEE